MSTRAASAVVAAMAVAVAVTFPAGAQEAGLPGARARSIVGIVVDSTGRPVDSAEVRIPTINRSAFTNADGMFVVERVNPARYSVTARKVGYTSETIQVVVPPGGASVRFALSRYVRSLAPAVTVATRTGIIGVVADTARRPIAGATVYALGSSRQVRSDSAGGFYLDVTPGRYLLRVTQPGYASQVASVTVPENEGRRVAVWLAESTVGAIAREAVAAFDLNERLVMRNAAHSRLFSREDLAALNTTHADRVASIGAVQRVDDACEAIIDGGPRREPLWTLSTSDIEFVEIYVPKPARPTPYGRASGIPGATGGAVARGGSRSAAGPACPVSVYVWLRR